jgi:hypothetical protein
MPLPDFCLTVCMRGQIVIRMRCQTSLILVLVC